MELVVVHLPPTVEWLRVEVNAMKLLSRLVAGGGVAAFFFFSWVIMTLWNSIVAGYLELAKPLNYLQTCGLWFMLILLFAWTGIAVRWTFRRAWFPERHRDELDREIERRIKRRLARWAGSDEDADWGELEERLEKKIKAKFREWLEEEKK
ncbi:MAG: hypothetical protein N2320_01195 [Candidatus Bipolaricaulota bacterium]|nr:hypothetical protein [Candidatus Bipolaricaulota bacterium]